MSHPFCRRRFAVPLAGLVLAFCASPVPAQSDGSAPAKTFVGPVTGAVESARVGVVADGTNFMLYVCSTDETFNKTSARWARGPVANGVCEGKSPDGAMAVKAAVAADTVKGTLTVAGKAMAFTATLADERTYAGLYRCEEKDGAFDYVAGWVVDEADFVAGNVQNRQTGRVQVPPGAGRPGQGGIVSPRNTNAGNQPPRGGNVPPNLNPGTGTGVRGQQVTNPQTPPTGAGKKITAQESQDNLVVIATNLERKGGSPLLALTIHQVRRFNAGTRPANELEQKTFARLARIPKATLLDYEKNWEKIPLATRQRILGPRGRNVDPATPLTGDLSRSVLGLREGGSGATNPNAPNAPTINSVRFTQFQCVIPADVRKDEVFYTCLVASGTTAFDNVSDIYKGIKKGDTKNFTARDSQFWPRFNTSTKASGEISIGVGLYDDDSGLRRAIVDVLSGLGDVAGDIAANAGANGGAVANGFQNFLESSAAAISSVRFIGSDSVVIKPNQTAVDANGSPKNQLRFVKTGVVSADYRFLGLQVN